ncbi:hypothetical protein [Pseudofrankia sp. DC12]|uniref:hypothetical protein n=1 Tax=Pseudofrankia sp. DC12 TaxID=683315 RepID=UPI0005F803B2|nr:hypothetical protein [Pseudofrankia sp. DC12]
MTTLTTAPPPATDELGYDEFDLDVSIVTAGLPAGGFDSADCTSDNCSATEDSAGVTCDQVQLGCAG